MIESLGALAATLSQSPEASLVLKITVAAAAGLAITALARRARAAIRHVVLAVTLLAVLALPLAAALLPAAPVVVATQHPAQLVSELPAPRSDRLARSTSGTPAAASAPTTIEYLVAHGARE